MDPKSRTNKGSLTSDTTPEEIRSRRRSVVPADPISPSILGIGTAFLENKKIGDALIYLRTGILFSCVRTIYL